MVKRSIVGGLAALAMFLPGASSGQSGLRNFTFRDLIAGQPQSAEQIKRAGCVLSNNKQSQLHCTVMGPAIANIQLSYYTYFLYNKKLTDFALVSNAKAF